VSLILLVKPFVHLLKPLAMLSSVFFFSFLQIAYTVYIVGQHFFYYTIHCTSTGQALPTSLAINRGEMVFMKMDMLHQAFIDALEG
jgi:hypothetical protein